jgi:hypothetical protein
MEELRDLGKVVFAKIVTETTCIGGLSYLYSKRGPLSSLYGSKRNIHQMLLKWNVSLRKA